MKPSLRKRFLKKPMRGRVVPTISAGVSCEIVGISESWSWICTDAEDKLTFMNRVAETMTGWQLRDAKGRPMAECVRIVDANTRKVIVNPME